MSKARKLTAVLLVFSLLMMASACNSSESSKSGSNTENSGNNNGQQHYPVTITTFNYEGEEVTTTYEKAPERVLAVYQGSIETMIVLGLEDHVIASYGLDNEVKEEWKAGLAKMNYNDSAFAPDRETVMMMQPDLILSWGSLFGENTLGSVSYWHENGTNTYINTNTRRGGSRLLENEFTDILNIGRIFDVEERAEELVAQMREDIAKARAAVVSTGAQPLVAVINVGQNGIRNYGAELAGDIVSTIGVPVFKSPTNQISKEDLVAANPDVIFVEYMPRPDQGGDALRVEALARVLDDPALASISAVREGRVYGIMLGDIYAPAVRTADGIRTFAEGLFPGLLD
jgi:iron complex transport system substrate-binding protein